MSLKNLTSETLDALNPPCETTDLEPTSLFERVFEPEDLKLSRLNHNSPSELLLQIQGKFLEMTFGPGKIYPYNEPAAAMSSRLSTAKCWRTTNVSSSRKIPGPLARVTVTRLSSSSVACPAQHAKWPEVSRWPSRRRIILNPHRSLNALLRRRRIRQAQCA